MSSRDDTKTRLFPERSRLPSYVDGRKQHYYPTVEQLIDPSYHTTSYELNFPKPHRFIKEDIQATRLLSPGIECQVVNGFQPDSSNFYYLNSSKTNSGVSLIYSPNHNIEKFNFHEAEVIPGIAAIYLEADNNSSNAQVTIPERILRNTLYVSSISIESERIYPTSSYEPDLRPRLILIPGGIEISRLSKEDATQLTKTQKEDNIIVNQERFTYIIRPINFDEDPIVLPERFTGFNIAAYQPIEGIAATRLYSSLYTMPEHSWLRYNSHGSLVIDNCREEER